LQRELLQRWRLCQYRFGSICRPESTYANGSADISDRKAQIGERAKVIQL
jgi:hypothetical protein